MKYQWEGHTGTCIDHRVVEYGSDMCSNCGNEALQHLYMVRLDNGMLVEVGCICATRLCPHQDSEIHDAERKMMRQDAHNQRVRELKANWELKKDSKGRVEKVFGLHGQQEFTIFFIKGHGWTSVYKDCPYFKSYKPAMTWFEENIR